MKDISLIKKVMRINNVYATASANVHTALKGDICYRTFWA